MNLSVGLHQVKCRGLIWNLTDWRLFIAQKIEEERKSATGPGDPPSPQQVAASVALYTVCEGDHKAWNSQAGQQAYKEVLAILCSYGLVDINWRVQQ